MKHAEEYVVEIGKLLLLLRRSPAFSVMPFADLCDHLAWYWNRGTMCYVMGHRDVPRAICLIKLFRHIDQFMDAYVHEPCGEICMIELMVAEDPLAMGAIFEEFVKRWHSVKTVMFDREERTEYGCPRMYSWRQFEKLARRLSYGVIGENAYGQL